MTQGASGSGHERLLGPQTPEDLLAANADLMQRLDVNIGNLEERLRLAREANAELSDTLMLLEDTLDLQRESREILGQMGEALEARGITLPAEAPRAERRGLLGRAREAAAELTPRKWVAAGAAGALALGLVGGIASGKLGSSEARAAGSTATETTGQNPFDFRSSTTETSTTTTSTTDSTTETTTPTTTTETTPTDTTTTTTGEGGSGGGSGDTDSTDGTEAGDEDTTPVVTAREQMLNHAEKAKTVPGYVKRMNTTRDKLAGDVHHTFSKEHKPDELEQPTTGAFCSTKNLPEYGGKITAPSTVLALADCAVSNDGVLGKIYNMSMGSDSNEWPEGVSRKEALKRVEYVLAHFGSKAKFRYDIDGLHMNHSRHGEDVRNAGLINIRKGERVLEIPIFKGKKHVYSMFFKEFKGHNCVNPINRVHLSIPSFPHEQEQPGTPPGGGQPGPSSQPPGGGEKTPGAKTPSGEETPRRPIKEARPNPRTGRGNDDDKGSKTGKQESSDPKAGKSPDDVPRQPQTGEGTQPPATTSGPTDSGAEVGTDVGGPVTDDPEAPDTDNDKPGHGTSDPNQVPG